MASPGTTFRHETHKHHFRQTHDKQIVLKLLRYVLSWPCCARSKSPTQKDLIYHQPPWYKNIHNWIRCPGNVLWHPEGAGTKLLLPHPFQVTAGFVWMAFQTALKLLMATTLPTIQCLVHCCFEYINCKGLYCIIDTAWTRSIKLESSGTLTWCLWWCQECLFMAFPAQSWRTDYPLPLLLLCLAYPLLPWVRKLSTRHLEVRKEPFNNCLNTWQKTLECAFEHLKTQWSGPQGCLDDNQWYLDDHFDLHPA